MGSNATTGFTKPSKRVTTNRERKMGMVMDYLGYKIRCQIEKRKENN